MAGHTMGEDLPSLTMTPSPSIHTTASVPNVWVDRLGSMAAVLTPGGSPSTDALPDEPRRPAEGEIPAEIDPRPAARHARPPRPVPSRPGQQPLQLQGRCPNRWVCAPMSLSASTGHAGVMTTTTCATAALTAPWDVRNWL